VATLTSVALGAARALDLAAITLVVGALAFIARVAVPAQRHSGEFARRLWGLVRAGAALGALASALALALRGAQAGGTSLWALRGHALTDVLDSRFGFGWALQALLLGAALAALVAGRRERAWLVALAAYLVVAPALCGHAAVVSPVWLFAPLDAIHVAAASVWIGGVAALCIAAPAALTAAGPQQRTAALAELLGRFSPLALGAVAVIAVTGVAQAVIAVRSVHALTTTTYGELVLLKTGLLGLLLGLAAINRERVIPALRRALAAHAPAAQIERSWRRTSWAELAALATVLAVTAALVATSTPR
jgi:copper transport protein